MPLTKLADYYPNYQEVFGNEEIKGLSVYTKGEEKVGTVDDVLVDDNGSFRYLVIDMGIWGFGKKILLPIGLAHINYNIGRVQVDGLSKKQVENLPEYNHHLTLDRKYEDQVRTGYQIPDLANNSVGSTTNAIADQANYSASTQDNFNYHGYPSAYDVNEQKHQNFKLYEERLIAEKKRQKVGEVVVGKRIERETATASVSIEKERVVIQRHPANGETAVSTDETSFQAGEVARIEIYEEIPNIHKEAFVREELKVMKVVDHDVVEAQETVRREELDVNTQGNQDVNRSERLSS